VDDASLTHPVRDSGTAPVREAHMSPTIGLRQITRAVSDGTGRSPEEVWTRAAATTVVTVSVVAARGLLWAVDLATDLT